MIRIMSFAYRMGIPEEADHVFDCRGLWNPHHDPRLRAMTGLDQPVRDAVMRDANASLLLKDALSVHGDGKTIAFGCFGGRHRSVAMAVAMADKLRSIGKDVEVIHRELSHL